MSDSHLDASYGIRAFKIRNLGTVCGTADRINEVSAKANVARSYHEVEHPYRSTLWLSVLGIRSLDKEF